MLFDFVLDAAQCTNVQEPDSIVRACVGMTAAALSMAGYQA